MAAQNKMEVRVLKNRDGQTLTVDMFWNPARMEFEQWTAKHEFSTKIIENTITQEKKTETPPQDKIWQNRVGDVIPNPYEVTSKAYIGGSDLTPMYDPDTGEVLEQETLFHEQV